jgi:TolB-like protein/Flp pilus assembly protein TadD
VNESKSPASFISELRRRQVFRAAAWYGGVAWLAVEVANTVLPQFGLPAWSVRAVIVAAILGLPVALALAWWFDLSALGLRREVAAPVPVTSGEPASVGAALTAPLWRVPSFWIALALGIGLTLSAQQAWQQLVRPAFGERPGLAVLPFANLSPNTADAWFADGLHEEFLATLARAGGLRVISRSSVQQYRNPDRNIRDIARALDVALILEGSVRKVGDDVRLTVQLIDGRSDEHLWAETYDRAFEDALQLQKTVALRVVSELGMKLSSRERRGVELSSPSVPEAYESYLRALALYNEMALYDEEEESSEIERLLTEALQADPGFALAYALRSKVRIQMSRDAPDEPEGVQTALAAGARADFERALALQPELPAALVARGQYQLWIGDADSGPDSDSMLEDLTRALEISPNDADTHSDVAILLRRMGRFDEAIGHFEQSAALTPGLTKYAGGVLQTLLFTGRLDEAERERRNLLARYPTERWLEAARHTILFLRTGDTVGWREAVNRIAPLTDADHATHMTRRMLIGTGDLRGLIELDTGKSVGLARDYSLGVTYAALGDGSRAQPHLRAAASTGRDSNSAQAKAAAAVALALLGQSAEAVAVADSAFQLLPDASDHVNGPDVAMARAWVLIKTQQRPEEGYAELERLLGAWDLSPRWVAALPEWRVLANDDPRVQEILRTAIARSAEQAS